MNISYIHILRTAAAFLLCILSASCSQDEITPGKTQLLPPGKYPLEFTATVEGMKSRSAGKDVWTDNDAISVKIYPSDGSPYPVTGKYFLNSEGYVKRTENPLSWPDTTGVVKAWFPYLSEGEVKTASMTDQSEGFKHLDFLKAETEEKHYTDIIDLSFEHQMTKVSCVLTPGDGISEDEFKTVKLFYCGFPTASFSQEKLEGSGDNVWITPAEDYDALLVPQNMAGQEFIKIELTVTVNGKKIPKSLVFIPEENDSQADLQAGKHYRYQITVQKDSLVVKKIGAEWDDVGQPGPSQDATFKVYLNDDLLEQLHFDGTFVKKDGTDFEGEFVGKDDLIFKKDGDQSYIDVRGNSFTMSYTQKNSEEKVDCSIENDKDTPGRNTIVEKTETKNELTTFTWTINLRSDVVNLTCEIVKLAVGDYYYSDGKTSKVLQETETRKCIGIIFKVGTGGEGTFADKPTNYKDENGNQILDKIQGYVVALEDATESTVRWCNGGTGPGNVAFPNQRFDLSNVSSTNAPKSFNGYPYFTTIIWHDFYNNGPENFPAVYAVENYSKPEIVYNGVTGVKAPETSSGWYLPSQGVLKELYQAKAKLATIPEAFDRFTPLASGGYWSVTFTGSSAYYFDVVSGSNGSKTKNSNLYHVRAVLTF